MGGAPVRPQEQVQFSSQRYLAAAAMMSRFAIKHKRKFDFTWLVGHVNSNIIRFEQVCELGPNELLFFFVIGYLPRSKYGPLMYDTVMGGRTPHHEVMTAGDTTTGTTILPTTPPPPLLLDPSNRRSATRSESKDLYHRPNTTTVRDSLRGNAPLRCDFNTIELPRWW